MQKYIQNIGLLVLLTLLSHGYAIAQSLQWSNPTKLKGATVFSQVIGENEEGIFVLRYQNRFYSKNIIIEKYDHRLALKTGKNIDLRQSRLLKLYMQQNSMLLIKAKYDKSKRIIQVISQSYDFNLKPINKPEILAVAQPIEFGDKGNFRLRISDNRAFISLLYSEKSDQGTYILHHKLLSDSLTLLHEQNIELPYLYNNFLVSDFLVSNSGVVDLACGVYTRRRKKIVASEVRLFRFRENTLSDVSVAPDLDIKTAKLVHDRLLDRTTLIGLYGDKNEYGLVGSFNFYADSLSKPNLLVSSFSESFVEAMNVNNSSTSTISEGFEVIKAIPRSDGGVLLIAEQKDIATEDDIILVNGIPQSTSNNIFNFNELLLLNIDAEGFLDWHKVITKNQTTVNDGGYFSSAVVYIGDKFVQLLYNDQLRNTGEVMKYTIYNNGAEESTKLFKTSVDDVAIIPSESLQVSSNKLIIPTSKNRRFALLKLQY